MNLLKKLFVYSVVITTVLWSVGASFVPVASAAGSYPAGSLLAMKGQSGAAVYLVGADMKKYVFPSMKEYSSWYPNFDKVVRVAVAELDMYPDGGAVTVRPGTKLVTHMNTAKVYAIEPGGILHWIPTDTVAKALYGNNWTSRLVDVIPGYFTSYKATGTDVSDKYVTGTVVKMGTTYYYISGTTKRAFASDAALTANGYMASDAVTVTALTGYTDGSSITGAEAAIKDFTPTEGGTIPTYTGSVNVSLAASNPASVSILADSTANTYPQAQIPFMAVNFTAGNDADATVTMVKFSRTGIASDADLGNMYLYDGNTRLAEYTSFSDKVLTFSNTAGLFTVPKGTTRTVMLKGDLARSNPSVTASKNIGFQMISSDYVTAGTGSISGSFPIVGNVMTTAAVADLGHVYVSNYATGYPTAVKADEANKELWRFNLTSSGQDMEIRYLKLTMVGTIASTDIKNLKLEVGGVQIGSTVALGSDNTVVFDLSANPIAINSGQNKIVSLRGDMNGGSGRVFKFTIQKSSDVVVYDKEYSVYNTLSLTNTTTAFSLVQPNASTNVDAGTLTVGIASDSPVGYIADGATGLTLAKFSFYAAGEAVKVENLTIDCYATENTDELDNVKLLLDGTQIGTTDTALVCDNSATTNYTFGNTFVIPAGTYKYVTVVADTTDTTITSTSNLRVDLDGDSGNAVGQTTYTSISTTAQDGRLLGVKSGVVTVAKNSSFGDKGATTPTGTAGASGVKVASFTVTAGAGEAVDLTQISLADDATSQMGDNFQNMKVMQGTTQIGTTVGNLNTTAGTYTFSPSSAIRINASAQVVFDIYADIKSTPADSATSLSPVLEVDSVTATGVSTSQDASYTTNVDLQVAYIAASGNLTITADADTTLAQQLVMGATDQEVAKFKFTTDGAEAITVSQIVVSDNVSSAATGTLKNVKLFVDGTQIGQTVQMDTTLATTTFAHAVFSNLTLTIPADSSKVVTVKADITPYSEGGTSASTHNLAILPDYDGVTASNQEGVTALGNGSGSSITGASLDFGSTPDAGVTTETMTVYRTKLTAAWASDTPSGAASGGAGATVAKFNITNTSNVGSYAATVRTMNVGMDVTSLSIAAGATRTLSIYKDSLATSALGTTTYGHTNNSNFVDSVITTFTDVEIAAGTTKTFWVTLDTLDATDTSSLSINLEAGDIVWYDGVTDNLTTVNSLPLTAKTLTY